MNPSVQIETDEGIQYLATMAIVLVAQDSTTTVKIYYINSITTITHTAIAPATFTVRDAILKSINFTAPGNLLPTGEMFGHPNMRSGYWPQRVDLPPGVTVSTIISECCGTAVPPPAVNTIYTGDDVVLGNRNVDIDSHELHFTNGKTAFGTGGALFDCALVEFQSTTEGILLPRMSGIQAEAIVGPLEDGLLLYCNSGDGVTVDTEGFWGRVSGAWCLFTCGGAVSTPQKVLIASSSWGAAGATALLPTNNPANFDYLIGGEIDLGGVERSEGWAVNTWNVVESVNATVWDPDRVCYGIPLPIDVPIGATIKFCGTMATVSGSGGIGVTDRLYSMIGTFDCSSIGPTGPTVNRLVESSDLGVDTTATLGGFKQVFCFSCEIVLVAPLTACTNYLVVGFAQSPGGGPAATPWDAARPKNCSWSLTVEIP